MDRWLSVKDRGPLNFWDLSKVMRGDVARLGRCTAICTQGEDTIKRSKPFKYTYEKEIVMQVPNLAHLDTLVDETFQVCIFQEAGLFFDGVYIFS